MCVPAVLFFASVALLPLIVTESGSAIDRDGDLLARVARIGKGKLGLQFVAVGTSHAAHLERNQVSAWDTSGPDCLLVEEGILLGLAADGHAPVIP